MATAKQKAAARRNIKKAQAARRAKAKGHTKTTRHAAKRSGKRKGHASAKQRAAAKRNIKKAQAANRKGTKAHAKSVRKSERRSSPKRKSPRRKAASKGGKRKGGKRKGGKTTRHASRRSAVHTTKTEIIKMPGHTTKVAILPIQTGARRSSKRRKSKGGKRKGGKRKGGKKKGKGGGRAREHGYAMENPLSGVEIFVGGLTGLLGFGVADVLDRYLATHALTAGTGAGVGGYPALVDTPPTTGVYSGLFNATAVIAPMGLLRWGVGLGLTAVPLVAARWVKAPVGRSALQFFGFGVGFRVVGKGLQDLFAYMFKKTSFGLRLYDGEVRAWAMKSGQLSFISGTADESGALQGAFPAAGLGEVPALGCGKCANCVTGVGACCMKGRNGPTPTAQQAAPPPPPPPPPPPAPSPTYAPTQPPQSFQPRQPVNFNPNPPPGMPGTAPRTMGSPPAEERRSRFAWGSPLN